MRTLGILGGCALSQMRFCMSGRQKLW